MEKNMKLIIDMGKVFTTYMVLNGNSIEEFQIIESSSEDILSGRSSIYVFDNVRSVSRSLIQKYPEIGYLDIVIPSKNDLIVSKSNITEDKIIGIVKNDLNINLEKDNLSVGLGKVNNLPNGGYSASLSIYDSVINSLYDLVDIGIKVNLYSNLDRLIYKASFTKGKAVFIDSSHTGTRVLYAVDGIPIRYKVYGDINGLELTSIINKPIGIAFIELSDNDFYKTEKGIEIEKIINAWVDKLNKDISKFHPEQIFLYGGLTQSKVFREKMSNITYDEPLLSNVNADIPEGLLYKYIQLKLTPSDFEINNLKSQKDIGVLDSEYHSYEDIKVDLEKDIDNDKKYFNEDISKTLYESRLNNPDRRKKYDIINKAKAEFYESDTTSSVGKIKDNDRSSVLSYRVPDDKSKKALEEQKKNYKKPTTYESRFGNIGIFIVGLIIALGLFITFQVSGLINDKTLNTIGIVSPLEDKKYDIIEKGLYDKLASSLKTKQFNSRNFEVVTISKKNNEVVQMIKVPTAIKGVEDVKEEVYSLYQPLEKYGIVSLEEVKSNDDNFYLFKLVAKLK